MEFIMKKQVTFRHLKSRKELQTAAMDVMDRFEKFNESITSASVEFIAESQNIVEFKAHVQGRVLIVKEASEDFMKSLNEGADKMVRQLKKHREKVIGL
jgi:ribosomal subunit interface protein